MLIDQPVIGDPLPMVAIDRCARMSGLPLVLACRSRTPAARA